VEEHLVLDPDHIGVGVSPDGAPVPRPLAGSWAVGLAEEVLVTVTTLGTVDHWVAVVTVVEVIGAGSVDIWWSVWWCIGWGLSWSLGWGLCGCLCWGMGGCLGWCLGGSLSVFIRGIIHGAVNILGIVTIRLLLPWTGVTNVKESLPIASSLTRHLVSDVGSGTGNVVITSLWIGVVTLLGTLVVVDDLAGLEVNLGGEEFSFC